MELEEYRKESIKRLSYFIDSIGLNGEFYSQRNQPPIKWGSVINKSDGEYFSPEAAGIELRLINYDEETKEKIRKNGLIIINERWKDNLDDLDDLYNIIIHESIHANRNLLVFDVFRNNKNENAYTYNKNNNKIDQNTSNYSFHHVDPSQEILKGNIDNSKKTMEKYASKTDEEIDDIEWQEGKIGEQMEKQIIVDEALVEIMAMASVLLYSEKDKKDIDIWTIIKWIQKNNDKNTVGIMSEIILKHHDFELFNWMLDPIDYCDDIHYDVFADYTKNDTDLVEKLYSEEYALEDNPEIDECTENKKITKKEIEETAIKEISTKKGLKDLNNVNDLINYVVSISRKNNPERN